MIRAPYDQIADQFNAVRTRLVPKEIEYLGLVLEGLPKGSTVLDLGCGTGHPIATHLASLGLPITGVDGSSAMLALARQRLPAHRWIHARMEEIEFDETFAAVICWDSLFHMPRQLYPVVIGKIHRWLEPGGRLMVSSGGLENDDGNGFTDTMFGREFYYDSPSTRDMIALVEKTGFEIVKAEMCDLPDGGRNKGKWATVAAKK